MPQEITQCYLPPGRGDIPALTPAEAGTRLSTLKCYLLCEWCWCCSYGGLDVRRKNATRESTSTLKAWLYEHIKNPYPTKGEKIMLAIITKMTLTQVTTYLGQVVHTHVPTCRLSSPRWRWPRYTARIRIFRFFSDFQKRDFLRFFEMTCQKVVKFVSKSLVTNPWKWVHILRSSAVITVKDHQSLSFIFLKNCLLKLKNWLGYDANIITSQDVWCWWLTGTDFRQPNFIKDRSD